MSMDSKIQGIIRVSILIGMLGLIWPANLHAGVSADVKFN
jgi:hypothetical protein